METTTGTYYYTQYYTVPDFENGVVYTTDSIRTYPLTYPLTPKDVFEVRGVEKKFKIVLPDEEEQDIK